MNFFAQEQLLLLQPITPGKGIEKHYKTQDTLQNSKVKAVSLCLNSPYFELKVAQKHNGIL